MALQHLRSSTANKRPTPAAMSDGQIALNSNTASPGLFFKDSAGALIKVGPVHVGTTAPNASPAAGGETGNTVGEQWLDTTGGGYVFKVWDGSAWRSETGEFVNVNGDTMTGDLVMNNANIVFEGATADDFETTLTVTDPTADRTITLPDQSGNVLVSGNASIIDADVNASAAIAGTKIDPDFGSQTVETTGVFSAAAGAAATPSITFTGDLNTGIYSPGADQLALSTNGTGRLFIGSTGNVGIGTASPSEQLHLTGSLYAESRIYAADGAAATPSIRFYNSNVGLYSPGSSALGFSTGSSERLRITSAGLVGIGTSAPDTALHVIGQATLSTGGKSGSNNYLLLSSTDASNKMQLIFRNSTNAAWEVQSIESGVAYRDLVLQKDGGRVGIGTTTPNNLLHVEGGTAYINSSNAGNTSTPLILSNAGASGTSVVKLAFGQATNIKASINAAVYGNDYLTFNTGSDIERARIDGSGRLLVGTSSSLDFGAQTQVAGTGANFEVFRFNATAGNVGASVDFARSGSSTVGTLAAVSPAQGLGIMRFRGAGDASTWLTGAQIEATVESGTVSATSMPTRLVFSTTADGASSPTERMRIDNGGNVYFNTTATPTTTSFGTRISTILSHSRDTTTAATVQFFGNAGECRILGNGNVQNTNNSYGAISDIKLKENVVDANSQWDDIKALQVRNYNLKEGLTHTQIGIIAQEAELVSPGLVSEYIDENTDQSIKCVNYSVLYMKAVKALQEAMERIEVLEAKVNALEGN